MKTNLKLVSNQKSTKPAKRCKVVKLDSNEARYYANGTISMTLRDVTKDQEAAIWAIMNNPYYRFVVDEDFGTVNPLTMFKSF